VVYDVLGRDVAVLADSKQQAGIHEITWDGKGMDGLELASGVYIFQLNTGSQIVSRKMLLSK
jgi:flagellar hook assembly protein FlgD